MGSNAKYKDPRDSASPDLSEELVVSVDHGVEHVIVCLNDFHSRGIGFEPLNRALDALFKCDLGVELGHELLDLRIVEHGADGFVSQQRARQVWLHFYNKDGGLP